MIPRDFWQIEPLMFGQIQNHPKRITSWISLFYLKRGNRTAMHLASLPKLIELLSGILELILKNLEISEIEVAWCIYGQC